MKSELLRYLPHALTIMAISLVDFVILVRARFASAKILTKNTKRYEDFLILVPIFGSVSYLRNVDFLRQYCTHVVLCTTTKETAEFNRELERIAGENHFRIFRSEVPLSSQQKPNPWRLFRNTLHNSGDVETRINREIARDEIIRDSFSMVRTKYCIFLDGDTTAKKDLRQLVGLVDEKKFDLVSVRVLASKENTVMEKLQAIEYTLAMDARKIYPWLTSGACMVAKTRVIQEIMKNHSLFFSGGDIEIGKLAKMLNYKVGHVFFEFYTDVPSTFKAWFKQRMAWFGGGFRHAIVNIHQYTWRHPMFYFYTTVLVFLLTPLRWYEVIRHPMVLVAVVAVYWLLIFLFRWRERRWFYFLFPFYALIQILILVPLGVYTYFKMARHAQNVGIIKLRHPPAKSVRYALRIQYEGG